RTLRNTCIIEGERGTLEVGIWDPNPLVRLRIAGQERDLTGKITLEHAREDMFRDIFRRELANFTDAIRDRREPCIPGREGKRAVGLIEACYRSRQLLKHPWVFPDVPAGRS
ncbi:MAG: Gfo/Idh/MocA family oxidoreductase, partial [Candidatus Entotheonellia bacterium]